MQPRDYFSTIRDLADRALAEFPPSVSTPVLVKAGQNLQAALDVGGAIALEANATWQGNFLLSKPTMLVGAGMDASTLAPLDLLTPVLTGEADDCTVEALTALGGDESREAVVFGTNAATQVAQQPHRIRLQGVRIQAGPLGGKRGLSLHGVEMTVDGCEILGFCRVRNESQGIWANNGPGPYAIVNSVIEGGGENIMFGGATMGIAGNVPEDIYIAHNLLRKPQAWRAIPGSVKTLFELKNARHVIFEDNDGDGCWRDAQGGSAIQLTVRNQEGDSPWAIVDDVQILGNRFVNTPDGYAVSILGSDNIHPSQQMLTLDIDSNLFRDSPYGFGVTSGVQLSLKIRHNTLPSIRQTFLTIEDTRPNFLRIPLTYEANVHPHGQYGINTGDHPLAELLEYVSVTGNVIEQHPERQVALPPGNTWIAPGGLAALLDPVTYKLLQGTAGY